MPKLHSPSVRMLAQELRSWGLTHREIASFVRASVGTVSAWTDGVSVTDLQRLAIYKRRAGMSETGKKRLRAYLKKREYSRKYTRDSLIGEIQEYVGLYGRVPLKREFRHNYAFRRLFGSWNKAIIAAGFEPNKVIFAKRYIATDGHECDSLTESVIDNFLFENGISHERNLKYPNSNKFTVDFVVGKYFIEYFGLAQQNISSYDRSARKKKEICKQFNISLIEIYPWHVSNIRRMKELLLGKLKEA